MTTTLSDDVLAIAEQRRNLRQLQSSERKAFSRRASSPLMHRGHESHESFGDLGCFSCCEFPIELLPKSGEQLLDIRIFKLHALIVRSAGADLWGGNLVNVTSPRTRYLIRECKRPPINDERPNVMSPQLASVPHAWRSAPTRHPAPRVHHGTRHSQSVPSTQ